MKLTAAPLVFDGVDYALLPPINGVGQRVADTWRVPVALGVPVGEPLLLSSGLGAQESGPVLVVGQIGEPVQTELVAEVLSVVVVDVPEVVLEDLEPALLLPQSVVGFTVLGQPPFVY